MSERAPRKLGPGVLLWLAAYLIMLALIATALDYVRRQKVADLSTPQALADWQDWKAETERQAASPGLPARRPVHSDEPPTLILLRDHFGVVVAMSLTVASCVFGFLMVVIRGSQKHGLVGLATDEKQIGEGDRGAEGQRAEGLRAEGQRG